MRYLRWRQSSVKRGAILWPWMKVCNFLVSSFVAKFYPPYIYNLNEKEKHPYEVGKIKSNLNLKHTHINIIDKTTSNVSKFFFITNKTLITNKNFNPGDKKVFKFYLRTNEGSVSTSSYSVVLYSPNKCNLTYHLTESVLTSNCLIPRISTTTSSAFYVKLIVTLLPHTITIPEKQLATGDLFIVGLNYGLGSIKRVNIHYHKARSRYFFILRYNMYPLNQTVEIGEDITKMLIKSSVSYHTSPVETSTTSIIAGTVKTTYLGMDLTYTFDCEKKVRTFLQRRASESDYYCQEDQQMLELFDRKGNFIH